MSRRPLYSKGFPTFDLSLMMYSSTSSQSIHGFRCDVPGATPCVDISVWCGLTPAEVVEEAPSGVISPPGVVLPPATLCT